MVLKKGFCEQVTLLTEELCHIYGFYTFARQQILGNWKFSCTSNTGIAQVSHLASVSSLYCPVCRLSFCIRTIRSFWLLHMFLFKSFSLLDNYLNSHFLEISLVRVLVNVLFLHKHFVSINSIYLYPLSQIKF